MSYYVLIHKEPPVFVSDAEGEPFAHDTEDEAHEEANQHQACIYYGATVIDSDTWDCEYVSGGLA